MVEIGHAGSMDGRRQVGKERGSSERRAFSNADAVPRVPAVSPPSRRTRVPSEPAAAAWPHDVLAASSRESLRRPAAESEFRAPARTAAAWVHGSGDLGSMEESVLALRAGSPAHEHDRSFSGITGPSFTLGLETGEQASPSSRSDARTPFSTASFRAERTASKLSVGAWRPRVLLPGHRAPHPLFPLTFRHVQGFQEAEVVLSNRLRVRMLRTQAAHDNLQGPPHQAWMSPRPTNRRDWGDLMALLVVCRVLKPETFNRVRGWGGYVGPASECRGP